MLSSSPIGAARARPARLPGALQGSRCADARRDERFTLVTLGRLTLLSPDGEETESLAKRRLKLALLAVLAAHQRPISRAKLVEMFWGDEDEARARHSLSDALSHLRRVLGRSAITTHDADVALAPDAPLVMDALTFTRAAEARDVTRAARLYTGAFLDGVEVEASPTFEHWVARERRRLESTFLQVCAQECLALARAREWDECAALAGRWLDVAPLSADAALFRLNALKAPGTREASQRALGEFEQLCARLKRDFDLRPEKPVRQLAEAIAEKLLTVTSAAHLAVRIPGGAAGIVSPNAARSSTAVAGAIGRSPIPTDPFHATASPARADRVASSSAAPGQRAPRRESGALWRSLARRARWIAAAGTAGLALVVASAAARHDTPAGTARPRVAVTIDVPPGDSSTAWLADGLPQMIASGLSRSSDVDVVPTPQVRALLVRRGAPDHSLANATELQDLGRRLGATLIVHGALGRDDRALVLDLTVHDARTGRLLRSDALSRGDAMTLADEAAARVLATVNAERPGFRVADFETSSVDAYEHFSRALEAGGQGRWDDHVRHLDAAIALDSGFISAVHARLDIALSRDEREIVERLRDVLKRNGGRATDFDRLRSDVYAALYAGEAERSEAVARQLVRRYPRDPRAYGVVHDVLSLHGRYAEAEEMWERRLALDSLSMEAGSGPCAPCGAYGALARLRMQQGKWAGAERAARRWVALQPDIPASWWALATLFAFTQRDSQALVAMDRVISLSGGDEGNQEQLGRLLVMTRRYDAADSLIDTWLRSDSPALRESAHDIRALLLRERGQFRASNTAIERMLREIPKSGIAGVLERGSNLARIGDYAGAALVYERTVHGPQLKPAPFPPGSWAARGFCWHHALLADAIAPSGDTRRLRGIADSLATGCAQSYFGRDRVLYHHVLGLIAIQEGRWTDAEAELRKARWGVAETWTRTNVALATAQLALGRPREALSTLRDAYATPMDGMGRYQPRSEVDYYMAEAFRAAGQPDSAAVYEAHVRRAWRDADPEVKRLLLATDAGFTGAASVKSPASLGSRRLAQHQRQ